MPFAALGHVDRAALATARRQISQVVKSQAKVTVTTVSQERSTRYLDCALSAGQDTVALAGCVKPVLMDKQTNHAVIGTVGGLGRMHLVQLGLLDLEHGVLARSTEETIPSASLASEATAQTLAARLFELPAPWYKRWWVWTAIGVVATAAIAIPIAVLQPSEFRDAQLP